MIRIFKKIREKGGRLTTIRKEIIKILLKEGCLLSKSVIVNRLKNREIKPNRSTIYRELQFLVKSKIIIKNTILGINYYAIPQDYHHHLVCINCNLIKKIDINDNLAKKEKQIAKQNNFNIINHPLEFYGYCSQCQA